MRGGQTIDFSGHQHFRIARYNSDGSLDANFNGGSGSVYAVFGDSFDYLINLRLQDDGKVVAAGHTTLNPASFDIELIRITADGSIDNDFGTNGNGLVLADINLGYDESDFLVIQPDGKILTGGYDANFANPLPSLTFSCFRFNTDGTPDQSFGTGGYFTDFVPGSFYNYNAIFVQGDGKLLTQSEIPDGTNAKEFINRFNADGTPDNTYGQNGTQEINPTPGLSYFQPDGKLLRLCFSSTNNGDIMLMRYNTDGTPDARFGNGGTVITDLGGSESPTVAAVQPDGKIIIGGLSRDENGSDFLIVRYNADGSVDGGFGNGGYLKFNFVNEDQVQSIALAPNGKIIFGGTSIFFPPDFSFAHFDILIGRLNPDGSFDTGFGDQGKKIIDRSDFDYTGYLQIQNDDKIVFSYFASSDGSIQNRFIERLNSDGSSDNNFGQNGKVVSDAYLILLQNDQKIICVGNNVNDQNNVDATLARVNTDGTPDLSFGTNGKATYSFTYLDNYLFYAVLSGNSLFAAGSGVDETGLGLGIIAKFNLESPASISCPDNKIVNTDNNLCTAKVYDIDPSVTPVGATVNYKLSGATICTGTGSLSGTVFNKGVTTVTYTLSTDETVSCSFTVTVEDTQLPAITNLSASPATLWPADHKLKDITVTYSTNDNCGISSTQISVSSNEPIQSGEREDKSPDWEILDDHHIRLRAERLESGNGRIYTITITATDASGNQTVSTVTVNVPKSMSNPSPNLIVTAAPNPTRSYFLVTINSSSGDEINLRLLDNKGTILNTIGYVNAQQLLRIGDKLKSGIYFLEATQSGVTKTLKLVKQ